MWCVMLGVLGVYVGTWRRTGVILSLIVSMLVGISGVLPGMLLDCLLRRARLLVRWFAVLLFLLLLSLGVATYPSTACIWDNCTELGTFDHVAWECAHRPRFVPKPAEFLSSRYGWVVTNQNADIALVQSWLIEVQQSIWTAVSQWVAVVFFCLVWLPSGLAWIVCLGFALSFPQLSRGAVCAWWGPPDGMEWFVVGAACCWPGRFWLLALLLLPPQLLCAVYFGAVQFKVHTHFLKRR